MSEAKEKENTIEAPPEPLAGRRFITYKPKGSKTILIHFVLPDGYKVIVDSKTANPHKANGIGRAHLAKLHRDRGLLSAAAEIHAKGGMTANDRIKANRKARALGQAPPFPVGNHRGRSGETAPSQLVRRFHEEERGGERRGNANGGWSSFTKTYEQRCVQFFLRVTELMLLGAAEDPQTFVDHIKAVVVETIQGARKAKIGRPPKDE
jgi:hypothetical protein